MLKDGMNSGSASARAFELEGQNLKVGDQSFFYWF